MAGLAAARGRRPTRRTCRSCTGSTAVGDLPERELDHLRGLRGLASGPRRQRRRRPGAERRARRGHVRARAGARRRASTRPTTPGRCSGTSSTTSLGRWREPDRGIWEVRGDPQHFTHSKVMAWAAVDRAVRAAEKHGLDAPVDRWRAERDAIHADVLAHGWNAERETFVQSYGAEHTDASLLQLAQVGFLPPDDPRILSHRRRDPRRARDRTRPAAPLPHRARPTTASPATSTRSWPARSGSPTPSPAPTTSRARPRCSTSSSAWPTTSACSPSSTTRSAAGWRATSRRRCRHLALVRAVHSHDLALERRPDDVHRRRAGGRSDAGPGARRARDPQGRVGPMHNNAYLLTCRSRRRAAAGRRRRRPRPPPRAAAARARPARLDLVVTTHRHPDHHRALRVRRRRDRRDRRGRCRRRRRHRRGHGHRRSTRRLHDGDVVHGRARDPRGRRAARSHPGLGRARLPRARRPRAPVHGRLAVPGRSRARTRSPGGVRVSIADVDGARLRPVRRRHLGLPGPRPRHDARRRARRTCDEWRARGW